MRLLSRIRMVTSLFAVATVIYAIRTRRSHGRFLRVPFEFRVPTPSRIRQRVWNPDDDSVLTPQAFGVGWTLNLHQAARRLGLIGKGIPEPGQTDAVAEPKSEVAERTHADVDTQVSPQAQDRP